MARAVFLDRDGTVNELIYFEDAGRIDTPVNANQFRLVLNAASTLRALKERGFLVILASNQPGVAKRQMTLATFNAIREKMRRSLSARGAKFDCEHYCLHHPDAKIPKYRRDCECRKPRPGLLLQAAKEHNIDLRRSYMVGDGLTDIEAGRRAGCHTILLSHWSHSLSRLMLRRQLAADYVVERLEDIVPLIR